jgi:DNA mismatch endonuclease (patch repair protein)
VFGPARVVVFVDGDFWHGHGWRERGFTSWESQFDNHRNPAKWRAKIGRNIERDREVTAELQSLGWCVVRVLESAVRRDVSTVAKEVESAVRARQVSQRRRAKAKSTLDY